MDRKAFLLEMRKAHQLKGLKPCFVMVKYKSDKLYHGEYIMSIKENTLCFQKINKFFAMLRPEADFELIATEYDFYKFETKRARATLTLYKKDGEYFSLDYMIGTKETFATEDNMERIAKCFDALGLHKMEVRKDGEWEFNSRAKGFN